MLVHLLWLTSRLGNGRDDKELSVSDDIDDGASDDSNSADSSSYHDDKEACMDIQTWTRVNDKKWGFIQRHSHFDIWKQTRRGFANFVGHIANKPKTPRTYSRMQWNSYTA